MEPRVAHVWNNRELIFEWIIDMIFQIYQSAHGIFFYCKLEFVLSIQIDLL